LPQLAPEGIVADLADQGRRGAELCRGNGLIGALAAGEKEHLPSHNGLADLRVPRGGGDNVHIDAAGYPNAAHAPSPGGTLIPGRIVAIIDLRQILR
jgi:hypothetical protein